MLDASLCEREEFGVAYCRVFLSVLYDGGMWYTHYSLDSVTCKHVQQLWPHASIPWYSTCLKWCALTYLSLSLSPFLLGPLLHCSCVEGDLVCHWNDGGTRRCDHCWWSHEARACPRHLCHKWGTVHHIWFPLSHLMPHLFNLICT